MGCRNAIIGLVVTSGLTYLVNLGLGTFMENDWWRGFISAMFFSFLSNVGNEIARAPLIPNPEDGEERPRGVTEMVRGDQTYLDSRAGIDGVSDTPKRRK